MWHFVNSVANNHYIIITLFLNIDLLNYVVNVIDTVVIQLEHDYKRITLFDPLITHHFMFAIRIYYFYTALSIAHIHIGFVVLVVTSRNILSIVITIHIFLA